MSTLHIRRPEDGAALADWRHVHNVVVPAHSLSLDDVRERATRNHLEVAHLGGELVGCSTVRPPGADSDTATVIARVLPAYRNRGFGAELYSRGLRKARELGAKGIETVVLSSNEDGLRFALRHGFTEIDRYLLPGDTVPWIDLRLS
ncbi:GNAT family N-acetyltransferase [Streptomyces sp. NPDC007172]|uniref:GNAT family N-acetyltransferase n=1 Tax=Streptomyces sp. NPDC007172 TaxID=3364776 RepID=UPI00369C38D5